MMKPGLVGAVVAVLLTVAASGGAETPTEKRLRQLGLLRGEVLGRM